MRTFEIKERSEGWGRPIVIGKDKSSNQSIILCSVATMNRVDVVSLSFW